MKYEALISGRFYHIYNKGNNDELIFKEAENYQYFLSLVKKYLVNVLDIYSYCLMNNHFHLLVRIKETTESKDVSKSLSNLFNAYAKAFNKKYKRTGSLFRDRFKRILIKDEVYLKNLIVYINLNPVHHKVVNTIESYKYVSYHSLTSEKETLLKREEVLAYFNDTENFKYYIQNKIVLKLEGFARLAIE